MRKPEAMLDTYRWRDFIALPDDDRRELIDGHLLELDMPNRWHELIVGLLITRLTNWGENRGLHVLGSGYRIRVSDRRGVQPDLLALTHETYRSNPVSGMEHGHPELVVEVISPSSKSHDRIRKVDWYAKIGVPEYWIVDADARTIERLVLDDGHYLIAQHATGDEVFKPKSFRGLKIELSKLWAAL